MQPVNVQNHNESSKDSGTSANGSDKPAITDKSERFGGEKIVQLKGGTEKTDMTEEFDRVDEESSCVVPTGVKSPPSHKPTRCSIINIRISDIILTVSAVVLFAISFHLSHQGITQLVGQSIPEVTVGFGILTFLIFALGVMANRRAWICGFHMQVVCLIILILAEALVICTCVFQKYEIFYESDIYWAHLSDTGKTRVMANWQCCGWLNTCDISDVNSIYFEYRHYQGSACLDATGGETTKWMMDIAIIFGSFVLFHILYIIYITACQSGMLKRQRQKEVKKGVDEYRAQGMRKRARSFARLRQSISFSPRFRPSRFARRLSRASGMSPRFMRTWPSETKVTHSNGR